jgi:RNA polymerase sigma-70 factor (ECF subfamily)
MAAALFSAIIRGHEATAMRTRADAEWIRALKSSGAEQAAALVDLGAYLRRAATYSLHRHRAYVRDLAPPALGQLAEDCAQDALLRILSHLDEFRGDSRFTTWAYAFAVNAALVAARRERWKRVPLDHVLEDPSFEGGHSARASGMADPHQHAEQAELLSAVRDAIDRDLTDRQRRVLWAVVFEGVPLDEVARHSGSNRNAIYKLLHDSRRKLKAALTERGFGSEDIIGQLDRRGKISSSGVPNPRREDERGAASA